ncbi:MAG: hypothetical protein WBG90_22110 [Saonia sp.]
MKTYLNLKDNKKSNAAIDSKVRINPTIPMKEGFLLQRMNYIFFSWPSLRQFQKYRPC